MFILCPGNSTVGSQNPNLFSQSTLPDPGRLEQSCFISSLGKINRLIETLHCTHDVYGMGYGIHGLPVV